MNKDTMIGKTFGLLKVVKEVAPKLTKNNTKIRMYECKCICGKTVITRGSSLRSGHTKGCGQKHRKIENLVGQRFNNLTVIARAEDYYLKNGNRFIQWLCKCDCGKKVVVRGTHLKNGHTKSCGCLHSKSMMGVGLEDLTGKRFGNWTVLYENGRLKEPSGRIIPLWHCRCDCGEERDFRGGTLKSGSSLSCGCYKIKRLQEKASKGFGLSKLEKIVKKYLDDKKIKYKAQYKYDDLRSKSGYPLIYDYLIYKNDDPYMLIECQGKQHYEPIEYFGGESQFLIQQENDKLKKKYARKIGMLLLEIPYTLNESEIYQLLENF